MKFLLFLSFLFYAVYAHNHDMGMDMGHISISGTDCPLMIVSYNVFSLDCQINIDDLKFKIDSTMLQADRENGKVLLKLPLTNSIPEDKKFTISISRGNQMVASLQSMVPMKSLPKPAVLPNLSTLQYEVGSGKVNILNAKTIYIPDFNYNGGGPDAFFWVGKGSPSHTGQKIPDERGTMNILGRYDRKDVILTLPGSLTVEDIDYLSVWCRDYSIDFGNVKIPPGIIVPPATYMPEAMDYSQLKIMPLPVVDVSDNTISGDTSLLTNRKQMEDDSQDSGKAGNSYSLSVILIALFVMIFK